MDSATDNNACTFRDILESAGFSQHVDVPNSRSGHTLDLIIDRNSCDLPSELAMDRQENCLLNHFETLCDLPSDHYAVICSLEITRPAATKKTLQYRDFKRIDKQKRREDLKSLFRPTLNLSLTNLMMPSARLSTNMRQRKPAL